MRDRPPFRPVDPLLNTNLPQHLAATGPNVEILREFLSEGASVHLRSRAGRTPLFLAANAGLKTHIEILREAGAHLHSNEMATARLLAQSTENAEVWRLAGVDVD